MNSLLAYVGNVWVLLIPIIYLVVVLRTAFVGATRLRKYLLRKKEQAAKNALTSSGSK